MAKTNNRVDKEEMCVDVPVWVRARKEKAKCVGVEAKSCMWIIFVPSCTKQICITYIYLSK